MQPSHWLFCPHPCPRPRVPFPQNRPTGRYLSRQDGGCAGAESGRPGWLRHFPLTLLWDGPGGLGFASSAYALDRYDPRLGPQKNLKVPCAAASRGGGGGRKRSGRKASKLPFQAGSRAPEKFFPPRRAPETPTGRVSRTLRRLTGAEGRRAPSWKRSGLGSAAKRGQHQKGEIPELDIERLFCRELPGPN